MTRALTVLVLAANRSNVASIRALQRAGFRVVVADRNPQAAGLKVADLGWPIDPADLPALRRAIRSLDALDGVMTLSEVGVRPAAALAAQLGLPGLPPDVAENATSKAAMRRLWRPLAEHNPPLVLIEGLTEARRAARLIDTWPLIVKPDRSLGGSRGVQRADAPEQLVPAVAEALAAGLPGSGVVLEPLVEGREFSCELFISDGRARLLAVGEKVKSPPPRRVDLAVRYPARLSDAQRERVRDVATHAAALLGIDRGPVHFEFVLSDAGLTLIEAGARCGGGLTPVLVAAATGIDEVVEAARVACGQHPRNLRPRLRRAAEYRFLILPPGRVAETHIPPAVREHPNVLDVALTVAPGETIEPLRCASQRAGFLGVVAETRAEATRLADALSAQITVRYDDGRTAHPTIDLATQPATREMTGGQPPPAVHAQPGGQPPPAVDGGQPPPAVDGGQPPPAVDGGQPPPAVDGGQPPPAVDPAHERCHEPLLHDA